MPLLPKTGHNPGNKSSPQDNARITRSGTKSRETHKENDKLRGTAESQSHLNTNNSGKKIQSHSVTIHPTSLSNSTEPLTRIASKLETIIGKHNPTVQLRAALEEVVEEIKKAAKGEKRRAESAITSSAKALYEHIKVDLSVFYKALDSKLSDIQHGQSKTHDTSETLFKSSESIHAITKELDSRVKTITDTANVLESNTKSYREALLAIPPGTNEQATDPFMQSDLERKERQLLVSYSSNEQNTTLHVSLMDLKIKANTIAEEIEDTEKPESVKIDGVSRTRDGSLLLLMNTKESATWLRNPRIEYKFVDKFAIGTHIRDRAYNILVRWVPITFEPSNKAHLREIEEVNNILDHSIQKARWIKPIIRRRAGQTRAHAIITLNSAEAANSIIRNGIDLFGVRVKAERTKQEPMQCLKCRGWEHKAQDCKEQADTCGTCGSNHCTSNCKSKDKLYCTSCKTDSHASWDRACPEFQRRCSNYDLRYPENNMPYFPTEQNWTMTTRPSRVPLEEQQPKNLVVNNIQYNNCSGSRNMPQAASKNAAGKRKAREGAEEILSRREGPNLIPLGRRREEGETSNPARSERQTEQVENAEVKASLEQQIDTISCSSWE